MKKKTSGIKRNVSGLIALQDIITASIELMNFGMDTRVKMKITIYIKKEDNRKNKL